MHATTWHCPAAVPCGVPWPQSIRRQGPTCMLMMTRLQLLGAPTFGCGHAFSLRHDFTSVKDSIVCAVGMWGQCG